MTLHAQPLTTKLAGRYDRHFYTGIALVASLTVFAGFAPTYFLRARFESTPLPLYLHVHGLLFTFWVALFVVQAGLVAARRVGLHRKLGWATAGLATKSSSASRQRVARIMTSAPAIVKRNRPGRSP